MSGKSLDDYTPRERTAYERGAADTHARYEAMQAQTSEWLRGVLAVIAAVETHRGGWSATMVAQQLREVLPVGDLPLQCECDECT